jgi:uncharacterized membrane protein
MKTSPLLYQFDTVPVRVTTVFPEAYMADLDLRPLSLGEILDRTFTLYRNNFLLFVGITAIPQLLVLGMHLVQIFVVGTGKLKNVSAALMVIGVILAVVGVVVYLVAYLFAQGGAVYAVSELYLGRSTTIGESLRRMRGQAANLFGVSMLNGLAIFFGFILLVIPGIYAACRLITCIPAALLEDLGARESLERSFALTKGFAGRSFVIYLLYVALLYAAILLFVFPFGIAVGMSARNPEMVRIWMAASQVGGFFATVLITPIFTIAAAVFYYDLRVRKEAFDLQLMMNPGGNITPVTAAGTPSMFS